MRKVYGVYSNPDEARKVLGRLVEKGCNEPECRIVSNDDSLDALKIDKDIDNKQLNNYDRSIIEAFEDDLKDGKTLILVGENDIDIEDPSRYNTSKEEMDKRELERDPLNKPYPEELHYEIDSDFHEED